jgi:hypothetical protein
MIFAEIRRPDWQKKRVLDIAQGRFGVSRRYVYEVMKSIDPDRRELIKAAITAMCRPENRDVVELIAASSKRTMLAAAEAIPEILDTERDQALDDGAIKRMFAALDALKEKMAGKA